MSCPSGAHFARLSGAALLLILVLAPWGSWGITLFPRKPAVTVDGLAEVTERVGLHLAEAAVYCLGDWNGDLYTDLLLLLEKDSTVLVYLWDHDGYSFASSAAQRIPLGQRTSGAVVGLTAADFDLDGRADLLASTQASADSTALQHTLYLQRSDGTVGGPLSVGASTGQVLASNLFGSGRVDLFGASTDGTRVFWKNDLTEGGGGSFEMRPQTLPAGLSSQLWGPSHGSATVDVDGDCVADLVVDTAVCADGAAACPPQSRKGRQLEFWLSEPTSTARPPLRFQQSLPILTGAGMISWADFDGDGDMDIVMPVQFQGRWRYVVVLLNTQDKDTCPSSEGCCRRAGFQFRTLPSDADPATIRGLGVVVIDLGPEHSLLPELWGGMLTSPPWVHLGDYNVDGYPDLLLVTVAAGSNRGAGNVTLWQNVPCTLFNCGVEESAAEQRTATLVQGTGVLPLRSLGNAAMAFFFTLDEEGQEDIVVVSRNSTGGATLHAFINNFYNDAFFFKSLGLSPAARKSGSGSYKPYSTALPGTTVKFGWSDLNGNPKKTTGVQQPSSRAGALYPPYSMFGLGRTYSYIEHFHCGYLAAGTGAVVAPVKSWLGLIPNARVVVQPLPWDSPYAWLLELYVSPSQVTFYVALSAVAGLAALALPILALHCREKREDLREIRQPFM
eukprot:RCo043901